MYHSDLARWRNQEHDNTNHHGRTTKQPRTTAEDKTRRRDADRQRRAREEEARRRAEDEERELDRMEEELRKSIRKSWAHYEAHRQEIIGAVRRREYARRKGEEARAEAEALRNR
jgi:hypothetical protein